MAYLTELFTEYQPPEALRALLSDAELLRAEIDHQSRRVTAQVRFSSYVPLTLLEELQTGISRQYGIAQTRRQQMGYY